MMDHNKNPDPAKAYLVPIFGALALLATPIVAYKAGQKPAPETVSSEPLPACPNTVPVKSRFSACVTSLAELATEQTPAPIAFVDFRTNRVMVECRLNPAEQAIAATHAVFLANAALTETSMAYEFKLPMNWEQNGAQVLLDSSLAPDGLPAHELAYNRPLPAGTCPTGRSDDVLQARTMLAYNPF